MSLYPANIDSFRSNQNIPGITFDAEKPYPIYAEDLNNLRAAIVAIEETLGINPQGAFDTVAERLAAIEARLDDLEV